MVNEMVERKDRAGLITSLAQQQLRLRDVNSSNAEFYLARLLQLRENQKVTPGKTKLNPFATSVAL